MSDLYQPQGSALEIPFALTVDDVAELPGHAKTTFALDDAIPIVGAAPVAPEFVAKGVRRIVDCYVMGMHAAFGLSNFAEPAPFLGLLRRFADDVYADVRAAIGAEALVDTSASNADVAPIVRALYPEVFAPASAPTTTADAIVPPPALLAPAPVIVAGAPRSGTTWLQRMLQAHPALVGPDGETCFFLSITDVVDNAELVRLVGRDALLAAIRQFGAGLCAHFEMQHSPAARRFLEKTPGNVEYLDLIAEVFPDASIIGIYRDGRDVVQSILSMPFGTENPTVAAQGWVRSVRALEEFAARSDRIRVVRYEELRADPIAQIAGLLDWVGLPVDDDVEATLRTRAGTQVSQHRVGPATHSPRAEREVYRLGGDELVALGYATPADVRAVKRTPAFAVDAARRRAGRLMRNR